MWITLRDEYITLGQLLKAAGVIGAGGEARSFLAEQTVRVNGEREQRRGRKLRSGDIVAAPGYDVITVTASDPDDL